MPCLAQQQGVTSSDILISSRPTILQYNNSAIRAACHCSCYVFRHPGEQCGCATFICITLPYEVLLNLGSLSSTGIHVSCRKSWRRLASCEMLCQKC